MMLIFLLLLIIVIVSNSQTTIIPAPQSSRDIDDGTYCLLYQRVPRDPASYHKSIELKRSQKCKLNILGASNQGIFNYRLNTKNIPVLDTASAIITRDNIDKGNNPPNSALIYAKKIGGNLSNTVPGQILGAQLGGTGIEITNIVPMAKETQVEWLMFEKTIHDCILNGFAESASLSWTILYRLTSDSRPFKITYSVLYQKGINECKNGVSKIFLN